jgi:hypothetical protein
MDSSSGLSPSSPFAFLFPFSLRRRGLFDIYICARSQLTSSAKGDGIFGLKIAEYWRQVNPLMIRRSAAFDVNPFDRAVADANDGRGRRVGQITRGLAQYRAKRPSLRWGRLLRLAVLYKCPNIGASLRAML